MSTQHIQETVNRSLLQMEDSIHASSLNIRVGVKLGGEDVAEEKLQEIVTRAEKHSPGGDTITREAPLTFSKEMT